MSMGTVIISSIVAVLGINPFIRSIKMKKTVLIVSGALFYTAYIAIVLWAILTKNIS